MLKTPTFGTTVRALALGGSVVAVTLAASAGSANATVTKDCFYGSPSNIGSAPSINCMDFIGEPASETTPPLEPVLNYGLFNFAGAPVPVWAAGQEGDIILTEGNVPPPAAGCLLPVGGPYASLDPACSDVVRVVNVGGQARMFFVSDSTDPADLATIPVLPAPISQVSRPEYVGPLGGPDLQGQILSRRALAGGLGVKSILLQSDITTVLPVGGSDMGRIY